MSVTEIVLGKIVLSDVVCDISPLNFLEERVCSTCSGIFALTKLNYRQELYPSPPFQQASLPYFLHFKVPPSGGRAPTTTKDEINNESQPSRSVCLGIKLNSRAFHSPVPHPLLRRVIFVTS